MEILNEKGAIGFDTTYDPVLDLFAKVGSFPRTPSEEQFKELQDLTRKSLIRNVTETAIVLFNLRDRLEGVGHRNVFRNLFKFALQFCNDFAKLIPLIPVYGRWDDLLCLLDSKHKATVVDVIRKQLQNDLNSDNISLLGKWLPSINASSRHTRKLAKVLCKELGYNFANYRKLCSRLRAKLKIVEHNICNEEFTDIDYSKVPSLAMSRYIKIFKTKDTENYNKYIEDVKNGLVKINTAVLNVVDLAVKANVSDDNDLINTQYDNLPDFGECNSLVCMDGSGSMYYEDSKIRAIDVAKSLTVYCADHNSNYKNQFITFGSEVKFVELRSKTFTDKLYELSSYDDCGTTNFAGVFEVILQNAKMFKLTPEQMIKNLIVISDMQFDSAFDNTDKSVYRAIKKNFEESGYTMPKLIFWNVCSCKALPMTIDDLNTTILSGWSQNMLRYILSETEITPRSVLNEVINSKRYSKIVEAL